ncbi:hypothetical protein LCA02_20140 [Lacticaseibacillus casei]|nr:hypothetical protein LCA02_20140 [Lacticaseibacillus casei]
MDTIKRAQKNPVVATTGNRELNEYYYVSSLSRKAVDDHA